MRMTQEGIDLIKHFEGCELKAYSDPVGIWTIGYGHTGGVTVGQTITEPEAEDLLRSDLMHFEKEVSEIVPDYLTPSQFSALVSFAFNVGVSNLKRSTLLKKINRGDIVGAAGEFTRFNRAGGSALLGLLRRRRAESELFLPS